MTQPQSCRTCRWAYWFTNIRPSGEVGACVYSVKLPSACFGLQRLAIDKDDGTNCPCWEAIEK